MKKTIFICMATLFTLSMLAGCSKTASQNTALVSEHTATTSENTASVPSGKIAVNFDGIVAATEGNRITLENGQVVLVSENTVFSTVDGVVEDMIPEKGTAIQGYTEDDPTASEFTASRIHIISY